MSEGRQLLGDVVHADSLLLVETADLRDSHVHPQGLLAAEKVVKLSIVVRLTADEVYSYRGRHTTLVRPHTHTHRKTAL